MKRLLIMAVVLGLIAGSVATAEAKTRRPVRVERTVEASYGPVISPVMGCNDPGASLACVVVNARSTEAFFTAKVTDAHGLPVFVQVNNGHAGTFCGETDQPISIEPGSRLQFLMEPIPYFFNNWGTGWVDHLDCPYRAKTIGTIRVTLSNLP